MAALNYNLVNETTFFIYWDIDGVVLDFLKGADWRQPHYWLNLPIKWNVVKAINLLRSKETELNIKNCLLSCSPSAEATADKMSVIGKAGLQEVFPIILPDGEDKSKYVNEKNAILVDDYHKNLQEWQGYPVKFYNKVNGKKDGKRWDGTKKNSYMFSLYEYRTPEQIAEDLVAIIELIRKRSIIANRLIPIPVVHDGNGKTIMYR